MRRALQRMRRVFPVLFQGRNPRQEAFFLVGVERPDAGGAGERVPGICVAMEDLDPLGTLHEDVEHFLADENRAHRNRGVRHPFRHGEEVRHDAEVLGGERLAQAPEAGDHLVEDEKDAVARADLSQPLQISDRRDEHARRARDWLDDHGGDRGWIVQHAQPLELVGELRAVPRLSS
jgi:hypothetical protein